MGLVTEYPIGLALVCLLLGAGYALFLYYRDVKQGLKPAVYRVMFVLRLIAVSLIAFLLLNPLIKKSNRIIEKPIVIIGVDNSKSMVMTGDSGYYRTRFPASVKELAAALQKKCEVRIYSFGSNLNTGFDGSFKGVKTDISTFFNEVNTRYSNRNAAALILASDGIYNQGEDPFYAARNITFPIYTIALGDTSLKKDILIRKVLVNKTAYIGDKFPVEVLVEMDKCTGESTKLSLSRGKLPLETREIRAGSDRTLQKVTFMLEAKEKGIARYSLKLSEIDHEVSNLNNSATFLVEVLDARQKIALLYEAPHPDVAAIRKGLEGSSRFEIDLIRTSDLPSVWDKYDLVLLNQVPTIASVISLTGLLKSKCSLLFIIGSQSDLNTLNNLKQGLIINTTGNNLAEPEPVFNEDFSLFSTDKKDVITFNEFPPLQCPFGTYQYSPLTNVLFFQKFGSVTTKTPLVMFTKVDDRKVGFITGENIWRWRISDYIQESGHGSFDLLMDKIVQYLATREDKSFFRIHLQNRISENGPVEMEAELFNASYELINEPDVNLTITDEKGNAYPFVFSKTAKSYYLNAGLFPVGEYTYKASATVGKDLYEQTGKFFVEQVNLESSNLVADHQLLYRIASSHDGVIIDRNDIGKLADKILNREDMRSVSIYQKKMSELIGNPWLFALILALLTAEWILRKREGI